MADGGERRASYGEVRAASLVRRPCRGGERVQIRHLDSEVAEGSKRRLVLLECPGAAVHEHSRLVDDRDEAGQRLLYARIL